ncbi:DUF4249 family protein [Neolewinella aurantiaca]|uniref:DUF4249 family protein n=1 Tax=Neolewinella aurantiaca TaxID=2602767 RepID=A0A5C7F4V4_9BACT|nr:DUF4249 family protein [Neolewinella aurantiaca]TXF85691.1 DUF4249 family protein [Neolewinella aurantiaca]
MKFLQVNRPSQIVLAVTFVMIVFSACEEPVELEGLAVQDPRLVVSANLFPGEPVKVRLTSTLPTNGVLEVTDITDAEVSILEGNEVLEVLQYQPGTEGNLGRYHSREFKPLVGRTYTLYASKNGYLPFEDDDSIPEPVPISNLSVTDLNQFTVGDLTIYDFTLNINYDDPEFEENYYDLRISQLVTTYYINSVGDTATLTDKAKMVQPPGTTYDENTQVGEASILVRDRPDRDGIQIRLQSRINPNTEILGRLFAELRTVSENYFDFQLKYQMEGQALPIGVGAPQVNVPDYSQRSLGVFSGYNRSIEFVELTY